MKFTLNSSIAFLFVASLPAYMLAKPVDTYFGTAGNGGILHAIFDDDTGNLTTPTKAADAESAGFIAIHPSGQSLYATARSAKSRIGEVIGFKINSDKTLTVINQQSSKGRNPCHVIIDGSGKTLAVANYMSDASIAAYSISPTGELSQASSVHTHVGSGQDPKRQTSPHPHSIYANPIGTFFYAADLGADKVFIYAHDSEESTLTAVGNIDIPGGSKGVRHMKFSSDGEFLYVLNELSLDISTLSADPKTGALKYIESTPALPKDADHERISASEIRIHPNGKYIYSAKRDLNKKGRDSISVFARDAQSGRIELINSVSAQVSIPRNFNILPNGKWMLVGGQGSNEIAIFKIDPDTGALEKYGSNIPTDAGITCIDFLETN